MARVRLIWVWLIALTVVAMSGCGGDDSQTDPPDVKTDTRTDTTPSDARSRHRCEKRRARRARNPRRRRRTWGCRTRRAPMPTLRRRRRDVTASTLPSTFGRIADAQPPPPDVTPPPPDVTPPPPDVTLAVRPMHLTRASARATASARRTLPHCNTTTGRCVSPASVAVTPTNPSIALGTQQQFQATITYSDNSTGSGTTPGDLGLDRHRASPPSPPAVSRPALRSDRRPSRRLSAHSTARRRSP